MKKIDAVKFIMIKQQLKYVFQWENGVESQNKSNQVALNNLANGCCPNAEYEHCHQLQRCDNGNMNDLVFLSVETLSHLW